MGIFDIGAAKRLKASLDTTIEDARATRRRRQRRLTGDLEHLSKRHRRAVIGAPWHVAEARPKGGRSGGSVWGVAGVLG